MAIYHMSVQIISRNQGRSAVAAAAYRSGEALASEWDGNTYDYTRKGWVLDREVMLPANAPASFRDRSALWNSVEQAERSSNAQLAREIVLALPKELSSAQQKELLRDFAQKNFVDAGMCADIAVHNPPVRDENGVPVDAEGKRTSDPEKMVFQNPHAHIMLTMRPLGEDGKWKPKTQKAYVCRRGNEERVIPSSRMEAAAADGWQKQYPYKMGSKKVWMLKEEAEAQGLERAGKEPKSAKVTDPDVAAWNSREALMGWRESWAEMCNRTFERYGIDARIDHRSYEEQGINKVPTVHKGAAFYMEKKGKETELGGLDRQIREDNAFLERFDRRIAELEKREEERFRREAARLEHIRAKGIASAYQLFIAGMELAEERDAFQAQMRAMEIFASGLEKALAVIGSAERTMRLYREQIEHTSPIQVQKRADLRNKIAETEGRIRELKKEADRLKTEKETAEEAAVSGREEVLEKEELVRQLKQTQTQVYREFYTLVNENRENMSRLREMVLGVRPAYEAETERQLREHYKGNFREDGFTKAKEQAPDIPGTEADGRSRSREHKR